MKVDDRPIQAYDVSINIVGPNGPELVGEYEEVDISIKNETEEYQTTNERIPMILDGPIKISGKLKRGLIHVDIISRVYGQKAMRRGEKVARSPRFFLTANIDAPELSKTGRIRVENCVFEDLSLKIKGGKGVVDKDLSFKAEGIAEL